MLTYEELSRENQRLRREISVFRAERGELPQSNQKPVTLGRIKEFQYSNGLEEQLWQSICTTPETRASSTILHWKDIILPNPACSDQLIAYDRIWNSWVHYALEYPHFSNECTVFMGSMEENSSLDKADASWMSVYFSVLSVSPPMSTYIIYVISLRANGYQTALLMMDDAEAENLPLPDGKHLWLQIRTSTNSSPTAGRHQPPRSLSELVSRCHILPAQGRLYADIQRTLCPSHSNPGHFLQQQRRFGTRGASLEFCNTYRSKDWPRPGLL